MADKKKTKIILSSGDYDKAMAAFIIANGNGAIRLSCQLKQLYHCSKHNNSFVFCSLITKEP